MLTYDLRETRLLCLVIQAFIERTSHWYIHLYWTSKFYNIWYRSQLHYCSHLFNLYFLQYCTCHYINTNWRNVRTEHIWQNTFHSFIQFEVCMMTFRNNIYDIVSIGYTTYILCELFFISHRMNQLEYERKMEKRLPIHTM